MKTVTPLCASSMRWDSHWRNCDAFSTGVPPQRRSVQHAINRHVADDWNVNGLWTTWPAEATPNARIDGDRSNQADNRRLCSVGLWPVAARIRSGTFTARALAVLRFLQWPAVVAIGLPMSGSAACERANYESRGSEPVTTDRRRRAGSGAPHSVQRSLTPIGYAQRGHRPRLRRIHRRTSHGTRSNATSIAK